MQTCNTCLIGRPRRSDEEGKRKAAPMLPHTHTIWPATAFVLQRTSAAAVRAALLPSRRRACMTASAADPAREKEGAQDGEAGPRHRSHHQRKGPDLGGQLQPLLQAIHELQGVGEGGVMTNVWGL